MKDCAAGDRVSRRGTPDQGEVLLQRLRLQVTYGKKISTSHWQATGSRFSFGSKPIALLCSALREFPEELLPLGHSQQQAEVISHHGTSQDFDSGKPFHLPH